MYSRKFSLSLFAAFVLACFSNSLKSVEKTRVGFFGFSPQSKKAQKGLSEIYSGNAFYNGFSLRVLSYLGSQGIPGDGEVDLLKAKGQFEAFGLVPSPPSRGLSEGASSLSLSQSVFLRSGEPHLNSNCFACHAGVATGPLGQHTVVAGAANNYNNQYTAFSKAREFTNYFLDEDFSQKMEGELGLSVEEKESMRSFVDFFKNLMEPAFSEIDTVGSNAGPYPVLLYLANLIEPKLYGFLTFSSQKKIGSPITMEQKKVYKKVTAYLKTIKYPPVVANPWYVRRFRKDWGYWNRVGYAGFYNKAHVHYAFSFTSEQGDPNIRHKSHTQTIKSILDFVNQTESPPYPGVLNAKSVQNGLVLYQKNCSRCHGQVKKKPGFSFAKPGHWILSYLNTELKDVGTDYEYNKTLGQFKILNDYLESVGRGVNQGFRLYWEKMGEPDLAPEVEFTNNKGYMPPPLVGLWSSAPYFHNGSVPTLEHVLDSASRPDVWRRLNIYDEAEMSLWNGSQVGLPYVKLTGVNKQNFRKQKQILKKERSRASTYGKEFVKLRRVYDTTEFGKSNRGHRFGDRLSQEQKGFIIEFLKSLSGPDITGG